LLFIDLDHFKPINDSEGHAAGDSLLVQVAEILSAEISDQDVAGRFGGDKFLVLLKDVSDTQSIFDLCDRILDGFSKQVFLNKRHVAVTASLGLVFSKQTDYQSADQVLRDADRAMYTAKRDGKNRYCVYDDGSCSTLLR
jgi:diguanylate cyclase (GGDEF)-like protein